MVLQLKAWLTNLVSLLLSLVHSLMLLQFLEVLLLIYNPSLSVCVVPDKPTLIYTMLLSKDQPHQLLVPQPMEERVHEHKGSLGSKDESY